MKTKRQYLDACLWPCLMDVFPAVPAAWPHAAFHRMRAEGVFVVSAQWRNGATELVAVERTEHSPDTFDVRHRLLEAGLGGIDILCSPHVIRRTLETIIYPYVY